jgi:hypothetical protein
MIENFENKENKKEKQQTPEEIRQLLEQACENGLETLLTVENRDGSLQEGVIFPVNFEGDYLVIETEKDGGYGFSIEMNKIKKVELQ